MTKKKRRQGTDSQPSFTAPSILMLGSLTLLTVFVYWNSLGNDFVFDDQVLTENPNLLKIHTLSDAAGVGLGWRPLLFFTYGLNYYWSGLNPYSYHAVNLLLHIINVVLVYFIIREVVRVLDENERDLAWSAFAGAAIFSVHPLLSSAVSYIAGRSSVLCAVFYFLAVLFFLKLLDAGMKRRLYLSAVYAALTLASGLLAWQSKQEAITLPVFLAALLLLKTRKRGLKYVVTLAGVSVIVAAAMWKHFQDLFNSLAGNTVPINTEFESVLPFPIYIRTYLTSIVRYYFPRFLYPSALNADPQTVAVAHWYSPEFVMSILVLAALSWFILRPAKTESLPPAGLAAILLSPLTAYALVPLADVVLEHRVYIAGLGIALLSAALFRWAGKNFRSLRIAVLSIVVVVFAGMTIQRNRAFANNITLWEDVVRKSPGMARAQFNLALAYQLDSRANDAIREYKVTLSLNPLVPATYSNIAALELDGGKLDEAEKTLLRLIEMAPPQAEAFVNLSVLYLRQREPAKAIAAADRAIAIKPDSAIAHFNKAEGLLEKGDLQHAIASYEQAVRLRPDLPAFQSKLEQVRASLK
ncbi:MAG: hypothetical protein DMG19_15540 [Acidobacteria bacterium]|nr:MAG: hypothetical protein DMG19_15540 [Acidobacteriota bacterium]